MIIKNMELRQDWNRVSLTFNCDNEDTANHIYGLLHQAYLDEALWTRTLTDLLGRKDT